MSLGTNPLVKAYGSCHVKQRHPYRRDDVARATPGQRFGRKVYEPIPRHDADANDRQQDLGRLCLLAPVVPTHPHDLTAVVVLGSGEGGFRVSAVLGISVTIHTIQHGNDVIGGVQSGL